MKKWTPTTLAILLLVAIRLAAGESEEEKYVAILKSERGANEKAWACRKLKLVGTAKSVPAIAALLTDKEVGHSARSALETMPFPEAAAALRDAVPRAAGLTKAGIIDSIGDRRDREAVPVLAPLVGDADPQVASSAAAALGKIGGSEAIQALRAARPKAPEAVRPAIADALMLCADGLLAAGDKNAAAAVCQEIWDSEKTPHIRTAAYRGMVLAAGDGAMALVEKALTGRDGAAQLAALPLILEVEGQAATKAFAAVMPKVPPKMQAALIELLAQRGDAAAAPAVAAAAGNAEAAVRVAALKALGALGDATSVPTLAQAASEAEGAEQEAARDALARLRGAGVAEGILALLEKASPAVQAELTRALGYRRDAAALPALLKMAKGGNEGTRVAALRSLALLADDKAAGEVVAILVAAQSDAEREAAEKALIAACGRSKQPQACAGPLLAAMKGASVPARCALLRVAGRAGGPEALAALRAAVEDKDAAIRDAAIRSLADGAGMEAAPDLLKLAREAADPAHRVIALRGYWRLVALAADRPVEERLKMCEAGMAACQRPEEKKLGLTELAKVPHLNALKLAETLSKDEAVRAEAQAAYVQIAASLGASQPAEAKAALRQIIAATKDEKVRAEATRALEAMDRFVGCITTWVVAGPYRQQGNECQALFDIPFGPEKPDAPEVKWKPAPPPADPSLSWQVDLSSVVGGDHCVVYIASRVYSPREQRVRLDIGTDDGIKLWVNGKLVHANNAIRGLAPGQDKAEAVLKEGWNSFLAKITQHTLGCGACIRVRGADGSVIEGLRFDAAVAGQDKGR
jgi:HEAT repeat protein